MLTNCLRLSRVADVFMLLLLLVLRQTITLAEELNVFGSITASLATLTAAVARSTLKVGIGIPAPVSILTFFRGSTVAPVRNVVAVLPRLLLPAPTCRSAHAVPPSFWVSCCCFLCIFFCFLQQYVRDTLNLSEEGVRLEVIAPSNSVKEAVVVRSVWNEQVEIGVIKLKHLDLELELELGKRSHSFAPADTDCGHYMPAPLCEASGELHSSRTA